MACAAEPAPPPPEPVPTLTREQLMDPQSCASCHPDSYREWSGSMHAYAAEDPVFIAMNARAQRESNGAVGDFCVRCHAPVALAEGLTKDGLNLAQLDAKYRGVTCYFCHSIDAVEGTHNAPMRLASDGVMRGGIANPAPNAAHRSAYSPLHDRTKLESSKTCGACHDIVSPAGGHIERTFHEWQGSLFSKPPGAATCGQCHMPRSAVPEPVAVGGPPRWRHGHANPGVDVALTPFPEMEAQRALVQQSLDETLQTGLCVQTLGNSARVQVILDNVGAGHGFPSGSTPDRRAWVEVVATKDGETVYESGVVAPGEDVTKLDDPDLWLLRDCIFDASGRKVHQLWQGATHDSNTMPAAATLDPLDPRFYATHFARNYPGPGRRMAAAPDRVRARVRLQPIGYDVLDELVATGDLSREIRDRMVVHDLNPDAVLEWSSTAPAVTWVDRDTSEVWSCVTTSNMDLRSVRTPAPVRTRCGP
jgi:hypothetical protein